MSKATPDCVTSEKLTYLAKYDQEPCSLFITPPVYTPHVKRRTLLVAKVAAKSAPVVVDVTKIFCVGLIAIRK